MNSSYRLNTTNFQFTQYHPQTFNMKLSKAYAYIKHGGCHGVCVHFHHKVSTPYNFNIQFPMYSKFITHVYDVTLNTSMHQYCVIFIAPPTGHRNSDKYPIYMTCIGFFISYTTRWHVIKRWTHPPTALPPINNQKTHTDHKFCTVWNNRQLRDAYTIIRHWARVCGTPQQHHAPTRLDCEVPLITACSFNMQWALQQLFSDGGISSSSCWRTCHEVYRTHICATICIIIFTLTEH